MLSETERRRYRNDGFLFPVPVLEPDEAARHYRRLCAVERQHGPMHYRVKPYLLVRSAFEIATSDHLLDSVEAILGPDLLLWDGAYIIKQAGSSSFVSWHQDLTYWGLNPASDDGLVNVWVALTPATRANGCMDFVRGSHLGKRFDHVDTDDPDNILHRGQTIDSPFDEAAIRSCELAPGEASFHHGWTVHGSGPNSTTEPRVGLNLNYVRPDVRQTIDTDESALLVRGTDRFGHFRSEPRCERDFESACVRFQRDAERRKHDVYDAT